MEKSSSIAKYWPFVSIGISHHLDISNSLYITLQKITTLTAYAANNIYTLKLTSFYVSLFIIILKNLSNFLKRWLEFGKLPHNAPTHYTVQLHQLAGDSVYAPCTATVNSPIINSLYISAYISSSISLHLSFIYLHLYQLSTYLSTKNPGYTSLVMQIPNT